MSVSYYCTFQGANAKSGPDYPLCAPPLAHARKREQAVRTMPWTEEEMAAEAEADALKEAARNRPPAPKEELIAQLNSAVTILLAPPSGQAVAEANAWLMGLTDTADCWPTCLAALNRATDDGTATALLSLCLSLVRQNKLTGAPLPSEVAPLVHRLWGGAPEATPVRRQACTLLCALACVDPHECDSLLDWPFSLGTGADAPLALHLLQDLAYEVFHRPLQSRPLNGLLQDVRSNAVSFLELCVHMRLQLPPPPNARPRRLRPPAADRQTGRLTDTVRLRVRGRRDVGRPTAALAACAAAVGACGHRALRPPRDPRPRPRPPPRPPRARRRVARGGGAR